MPALEWVQEQAPSAESGFGVPVALRVSELGQAAALAGPVPRVLQLPSVDLPVALVQASVLRLVVPLVRTRAFP